MPTIHLEAEVSRESLLNATEASGYAATATRSGNSTTTA